MLHALSALKPRLADRLSRRVILGLAAWLFTATTANANTTCAHHSALITLAKQAVASRDALPKLQARRIGTLSAYLLLRYGALGEAEAKAVLDRLLAAKAQRAEELVDALAASKGGASGLSMEAIASSSFQSGAQRALIRSADRAHLLAAMAKVDQAQRSSAERTLAIALVDLPDAEKKAIAAAAQENGLNVLAGGLLASLPDTKPWLDFIAAFSPDDARALADIWYWMPAIVGKPDLPRQGLVTDVQSIFNRAAISATYAVVFRLGEADFLATYLNQTGDTKTAAFAAAILLPKFSAGNPDPVRDPAAAWLEAYRSLVAASGQASRIESTLAGISLRTRRHQGGDVLTLVRWAAAMQALSAFVASKGDLPAAPPVEIHGSASPSWVALVETATALRQEADIAAFAGEASRATMAAELLFAARRADDLATLINAVPDKALAAVLAEDFALRLDRLCEGHSASRGEALFFPGEPLFRFD